MKRALFGLMLLASVSSAGLAQADSIAASLYEEGVSLLKEGKFEAACEKLEASQNREALSGTLMTLAQCHELSGKTATAWDEYKRAAGLAQGEGRAEYEAKAHELANALEPKLSRLKLELATGARHPDVRILLAGEPVDLATIGVALALDPGEYDVESSAPGRRPWTTTIAVNKPGETVTVVIPALDMIAQAPEAPVPAPVVPSVVPTPPPPPAPDQPDEGGGVAAWAWVGLGLGLASAGVSFAFLGVNRSVAGDLDAQCGGEARDDCPPIEDYDAEGDHELEQLSSGMFIGFGAAAIVGVGVGVVGIIVGASDDSASGRLLPLVSPNVAGLLYQKSF